MTEGPAAFVSVGTDFHPFDRLVSWVDQLAADQPATGWLMQHGYTRAPKVAAGQQFLVADDIKQAFAAAPFVVTHGGPATVTEARKHGHLPIVVPRDPAYGEHVDEHQLRFARKMHAEGIVVCCETEEDLRTAVHQALSDPAAFRLSEGADADGNVARTVQRFAEIVDPLVGRPRNSGPTVLYLGGFGRSGTTLFERLMGEAAGVCVLGEVVHLWERGLLANERCGCSLPFLDCPQWRRIGQKAFGGWENVDVARVLALKARVDRNRFIPQVAGNLPLPGFRAALREYVGYYERLYAAAAEVTGASVVVDSSKHASLAFCLTRSSVDLRVLHVVRDSPGVAHSWTKQVQRPEADGGDAAFMPRYSAAKGAVLWDAYNALFELLRLRRTRFSRVQYEQLICSPAATLREVATFAGVDPDRLPVVADGSVELAASHTVAGNPMRFRTGSITLRSDDSWRTQMSARSQMVVAAITAPQRAWYGYGLSREGRRAG